MKPNIFMFEIKRLVRKYKQLASNTTLVLVTGGE